MKVTIIRLLSFWLFAGASNSYTQNIANDISKNSKGKKPTILFVHGLWAYGSCWNKVIATLQAKGYDVLSAQKPNHFFVR